MEIYALCSVECLIADISELHPTATPLLLGSMQSSSEIILNHIWVSVLCFSLYPDNCTMVQNVYVALGGPFPGVHSKMYVCLAVSELVGY